jgi:formyl-CoA transferase
MDLVRSDHAAPPARSVAGMGDHPSAMTLFAAISTALYQRERSGRGGVVSTSLLANGLWANACFVQARLFEAPLAPRPPRERSATPMTNLYRCRGGRWLNLVMLNEARQFVPLAQALGVPQLADDSRFADPDARRANHVALIGILDERFAQRDLAEWRERLDAAGVTFGVVGTLDDLLHDDQARASGALVPFENAPGLTVSSPLAIAGVDKRAPRIAPALGEHGPAILREAGFDDDDITRLRGLGVIGG